MDIYYAAACQTDFPAPMDRSEIATRTKRMCEIVEQTIVGYEPFFDVRLLAFPNSPTLSRSIKPSRNFATVWRLQFPMSTPSPTHVSRENMVAGFRAALLSRVIRNTLTSCLIRLRLSAQTV